MTPDEQRAAAELYATTDALSVIRCHAETLGTKHRLPMSRQLVLDMADNLEMFSRDVLRRTDPTPITRDWLIEIWGVPCKWYVLFSGERSMSYVVAEDAGTWRIGMEAIRPEAIPKTRAEVLALLTGLKCSLKTKGGA